jgi:mannose-6-phosphate isomerase-like protein (cupin superfamily)
MTRRIAGLAACFGTLVVVQATPSQTPPPTVTTPAAQPAPQGRGGGGGGGERPTNERSGVQIDQFIGHPLNSTGHLSHGGLLTRAILRHGNPNVPGPPGAVLEHRTQLATALLQPQSSTALLTLGEQFLFQVTGGRGRLDDGTNYWELREGISVLVPPGVPRRFTNTFDAPLEMVMLEWPANERARKDILVRDVNLMPYCEENVHWNNMSKCIFGAEDGMTGRVLIVMSLPFTMASPHPHTPGTEEFWTNISPVSAILLLGSELREIPQYSAFLAPPNGSTWHAQINTSKSEVARWLYVAGGTPPSAGRGGGAAQATAPPPAGATPPVAQAPAAGRGRGAGGNPNLLNRDPAAIERATVKGIPLQ